MSAIWVLLVLAYALVAAGIARLLPIAVSRSLPETADWYERRSAAAQHLLHGLGGLLWPVILVGVVVWGIGLWIRR
jgi:hypothetical protein